MSSTLTAEPLTALDRCDRCGAPASMRVIMATGGDLLFCGHHGRAYTPRLIELDANIITDTAPAEEPAATPANID